jgi:hypothetical protein
MQAAPGTPSASIMRRHHNTSFNIGIAPSFGPIRASMPATAMFIRDDFWRMAEQLAASQGKFLPSLNDLPEVKESSAFMIEAVQTTYSIGKQRDGSGARAQVLIRDFLRQ